MNLEAKMRKLVDEVNRHNRLYYVEAAPAITDQAYDILCKELADFEKANPDLVVEDSPTQRVGNELQGDWVTVEHTRKMLSLDNTYDRAELEAFDARIRKDVGDETFQYSAELKIDGAAVSIWYKNGVLERALTRGDGEKGEDITHNIRTIQCIPIKLADLNPPEFVEIRGEAYMLRSVFAELNKAKGDIGDSLLKNPRNAAAGAIKRKDPKKCAESKLSFFAHTFGKIDGLKLKSHSEFLQKCKEWGIPTVPSKLCKNIREVWKLVEAVDGKRKVSKYDTDGIVVKIDSLGLQDRLGHTSKSPKYAIAYKYPAEQVETILQDIDIQVGKTGALTPVGRLKPVEVGGTTVSNVTLCNQDYLDENDIRIGDTVIIQKAGEIIPQVVAVVKERRNGSERVFKIPMKCPVCEQAACRAAGEVAIRCVNDLCKAKLQKLIEYFVSRKCMDIDGIGSSLIEKLIENDMVKDPSDLYRLTEDDFQKLDGVKTSAAKYVKKIEDSKKQDLSKLIAALNIPMIGRSLGEVLASEFESLDNLRRASFKDLEKLEKLGTEKAKSIVEWFQQKRNSDYIDRLISSGVNTRCKVQKIKNSLFEAKVFVLTGTMEKYSRDQAAALIKQRGGKTSGSVSQKTDFVLAGEKAGSKLKKALSLGIKIIDEQAFEKMLQT